MRSPVRSSARPPPAAASGDALRIEGDPEVPGLPAVADAGQRRDAAFDQRRRGLHVHHLGRAGIADRSDAADHQDGALVDAERGVVDAVVVILGALEHHGTAFEGFGIGGVGEIAAAEFFRDHARLHDRGIEQIATQQLEAGGLFERIAVRQDHVAVPRAGAL